MTEWKTTPAVIEAIKAIADLAIQIAALTEDAEFPSHTEEIRRVRAAVEKIEEEAR